MKRCTVEASKLSILPHRRCLRNTIPTLCMLLGACLLPSSYGQSWYYRSTMAPALEHQSFWKESKFGSSLSKDVAALGWWTDSMKSLSSGIVPSIPPSLRDQITQSLELGRAEFLEAFSTLDKIEMLPEVVHIQESRLITTPGDCVEVKTGSWVTLFSHCWIGALYHIEAKQYDRAHEYISLGLRLNRLHLLSTCEINKFNSLCQRQVTLFTLISANAEMLHPSLISRLKEFPFLTRDVAFFKELSENTLKIELADARSRNDQRGIETAKRSIMYLESVYKDLGESDVEIAATYLMRRNAIWDEEPEPVEFHLLPNMLAFRQSYNLVQHTSQLLARLNETTELSRAREIVAGYVKLDHIVQEGIEAEILKEDGHYQLVTRLTTKSAVGTWVDSKRVKVRSMGYLVPMMWQVQIDIE